MEVRDNGIWAIIEWNDAGKNLLLQSPRLFLTPVWILRPEFPDVFTPYKLIKINLNYASYPPTKRTFKTLKTKSLTDNLLGQNAPVLNNREHFLSLVDAHMQKSGDHYLESWNTVKQNNPTLYKSFQWIQEHMTEV